MVGVNAYWAALKGRRRPFGKGWQMRIKINLLVAVAALTLLGTAIAYTNTLNAENRVPVRGVVTSDTILSGMIAALLPPGRYVTQAILPPGQCPGHYDVKLSDIEKIKTADLNVSFKGMPFMKKAGLGGKAQLLVDAGGRNWMAPGAYIQGLMLLAGELSKRFVADADEIRQRRDDTICKVRTEAGLLLEKIKGSGSFGKPLLASSMQKEPLEWMGFRVVAQYGRQESISTRELVRLLEIGQTQKAIMVVDNLQSGPEVGKGIAESLGIPHVVLTNFPSETGYLATLAGNVEAVLAALKRE